MPAAIKLPIHYKPADPPPSTYIKRPKPGMFGWVNRETGDFDFSFESIQDQFDFPIFVGRKVGSGYVRRVMKHIKPCSLWKIEDEYGLLPGFWKFWGGRGPIDPELTEKSMEYFNTKRRYKVGDKCAVIHNVESGCFLQWARMMRVL